MAQLISEIDEAIDMITARLTEKAGVLGLQFVGTYGEKRVPQYPAVVIVPGPKEKVLHGENTFNIILIVRLFVYHANLTLNKRDRTKADLQLVTDIENELESDYGWQTDPLDTNTKRIIFGYVSDIEPGNLQPRSNKSDLIIGTMMVWRGLTQRRLKIG